MTERVMFVLYDDQGDPVSEHVTAEEAMQMSSVVHWRAVDDGWDGYAPVRGPFDVMLGGTVIEARLERCAFIRKDG